MTLLAGWALTWWIHAGVAGVLALAAGRWLLRNPADRDLLWKAALVLPLVTAAVATRNASRPAPSPADPIRTTVTVTVESDGARRVTSRVADRGRQWMRVAALAGMLSLGAVGLGVFGVRMARSHRKLRDRQPVDPARFGLAPLPVRLSLSPEVGGAAALSRSEICVSEAVLADLDRAQQRAVLAHEMAHAERWDPEWALAMGGFAALAACQPLVGVVVRRLRRDMEAVCDERAVRRTGDPVSYLAALAALARPYDADTPVSPLPGYQGSLLVARAERVRGAIGEGWAGRQPMRLALGGMFVALVLLLAAPAAGRIPAPVRIESAAAVTTSRDSVSTTVVLRATR